jgi:hypothetical protein
MNSNKLTQNQVRRNFWETLKFLEPDLYKKGKRSKRQNEQITDIRIFFCDYIEHLRQDGDITEEQANKFTL